jgi:O-antigen/teichoic acid export membrane protein
LGNLGLHASNTYYVSKKRELLAGLAGNSLWVSFIVGGSIAMAVGAFFTFVPSWAPVQGWALWIGLLWIPFSLAYLLFQNLLLGIQEVRSFNQIEIATKTISVGILLLLVFCQWVTVESVLWANFAAQAFGFLLVFMKVHSKIRGKARPSFSLFRENISYGLKAYWTALFSFLVIRIDLLMVQYMKGPEQSGYYSVAASLAELIFMLPTIVGTILFPKLSGMATMDEKWEFTKKITWGMAVFLLLIVMATGALSGWLTPLVYGAAYLPSVPALIYLLPGIYFLGVEVVLVQFLNSEGFPQVVVWNWVFVTLLNVGLNLWWIPRWGMIGASASSSVCYFLIFCFISFTTHKILKKKRP